MSVQRSVLHGTSLLLFVALTACSSRESTTAGALIDSSGGSLVITEGAGRGTGIEVPSGAVDEATRFEIVVGTPDRLTNGLLAVGPMITFRPEGAIFALPVRISIPATREPTVLFTRPHASATWTRVDGAVWDGETGLASASVMHFSDYVPAEREDMTIEDGGLGDRDEDFCTMNPRDPSCIHTDPPLPGCDAIAQDCAAGEMCIAADQESGYGWGEGRPAYCVSAGTATLGSPCDAPSDCAVSTQCVFRTMYDPGEATIWYSQEIDYLPMYASSCMSLCTHGGTDCPTDEVCHPIQLWGFSGRRVNEVVGVCAPPPPDEPPRE